MTFLKGTGPLADSTCGVAVSSRPRIGFELVDGPDARAGPVAVRLVHEEHEVVEVGQVVEVALADVLRETLDARRLAAADLAVDLRDVEDVDAARRELVEERRVVVVAGDDLRRLRREFGDAAEDVLRRVRREVGDELRVDRQIRREHEEVAGAVRQVQIGDEGAHQPRLADAGGKGEADRREVALEVRDAGPLGLESRECRVSIGALAQRCKLRDPVQDLERVPLRRAQAQSSCNGVDEAVHSAPSSKPRPCWPRFGGAALRLATSRL